MSSKGNAGSISNKIIISIVVIVVVVAAGFILYKNTVGASKTATNGQVAGVSSQSKTSANNPKVNINKTFSVKALDATGKPAKTNINMKVNYAEKTQDILIKGTPATAKNGSAFAVFQIDLQNTSNERLIVSPLDLLRLIVDDQKRAAEIYTEEISQIKGSVVVEPDSTKITRIGFVLTPEIVNKSLKLQVGEVNSVDRKVLDVNF